eukprot:GHVQ01006231.1.p1 GENE.GHVQ01006231.1~~GHVQ01006231.1.p1  ORF type:complete len:200 (-),score=16.20 GHVQ01006231.1:164-763(-)
METSLPQTYQRNRALLLPSGRSACSYAHLLRQVLGAVILLTDACSLRWMPQAPTRGTTYNQQAETTLLTLLGDAAFVLTLCADCVSHCDALRIRSLSLCLLRMAVAVCLRTCVNLVDVSTRVWECPKLHWVADTPANRKWSSSSSWSTDYLSCYPKLEQCGLHMFSPRLCHTPTVVVACRKLHWILETPANRKWTCCSS